MKTIVSILTPLILAIQISLFLLSFCSVAIGWLAFPIAFMSVGAGLALAWTLGFVIWFIAIGLFYTWCKEGWFFVEKR